MTKEEQEKKTFKIISSNEDDGLIIFGETDRQQMLDTQMKNYFKKVRKNRLGPFDSLLETIHLFVTFDFLMLLFRTLCLMQKMKSALTSK